MPHQCVNCGALFPDGARDILKGCNRCNGKLFFYIKKEKYEQLKKKDQDLPAVKLSTKDKTQIEKDVREIVGNKVAKDEPVVLDLESIRIKKPGQYELDLVHLFKGDPLVFKLEEGKYMIDIIETFNTFTKKKK